MDDPVTTIYPLQAEALSRIAQDGPTKIKQTAAGAIVALCDDGSQFRVNTDGYTIKTVWPHFKEGT